MPGASAPHDSPPGRPPNASAARLEPVPGWLFEHVRDAILVIDLASQRVLLANPAAEHLFGGRAQLVGAAIGGLIAGLPESAAWHSLLAGEPVDDQPLELRAQAAPGEFFRVEVFLSRLDNLDGPAPRPCALAVIRDRTDRPGSGPGQLASDDPLGGALAIQGFLDHATRELTSSLDYETTLHGAARLAVPRLGDACVVDVFGEDQVIERVAAAHVDLDDEQSLLDLADSYPREASERQPAFGESARPPSSAALFDAISDADWNTIAPDPPHAEVLARLGLRCAMLVPLVVRGRLLGSMLFAAGASGHFADADLRLAEDLARRCALAIDNARLYRRAQEAIASRDQFVSIASHELRAPLTRLKSHVEVLLLAHSQGQLDQERLVWSVRRINAAADRLAALTKDLLDVSRLQGGQLPFRPGPLDLGQLLSDLVPRYADQLDPSHSVVLELGHTPAPVLVDHDRIEQVLGNLLDNAAKYSPDGGQVRVRLEPSDDGVLLAVEDQGVGLPPGSADLIFEPFGRASNAADWNVPGLGLGLHICRIIVERHGGRIWATSRGEGSGTTVWVWLPLATRSSLPRGDIQDRLTNQLTLAVGYCELLATNPSLAPDLRAQALEAMNGAQQVAAELASVPGAFPRPRLER